MSSYQTQTASHRVGNTSYEIRGLLDRQQFSDPTGSAQRQGIGEANWSLFGVIWPAAEVLAACMAEIPINARTFLEIGCGLGLPSIVLQERGASVTACDYHPLAREFLEHNCELNGLVPVVFQLSSWAVPDPTLGRFSVLIASDTLYERDHPELLAAFFERHALPACEIILADPGRGRVNQLTKLLEGQGYTATSTRCAFEMQDRAPFRGQVVSYRRDAPTLSAE